MSSSPLAPERLVILPASRWADVVAGLLADRLAATPDLVMCLPTGATPLPVYERLPTALRTRGASAGRATIVSLDEYLGLPAGHPARCDAVLHRTLIDRLDPAPARWIGFEVDGSDPTAACRAFDAALAAAGGLDLVVLGLGRNGHIGMNEPGSTADAPTRVVELTPSTRDAAIAYGADPPPTHGLTLGLAGIRAAREVWLLATGSDKAGIVARSLEAPVTPDLPASLVREHAGWHVIVDAEAASGLGRG